MPTEPICTVAVAMAGVSLTLSVASLLNQNSSFEPDEASPAKPPAPAVGPVRNVSLKMSAVELRRLCQRHRIHNARWRNSANKTVMVQALFAAGVKTNG